MAFSAPARTIEYQHINLTEALAFPNSAGASFSKVTLHIPNRVVSNIPGGFPRQSFGHQPINYCIDDFSVGFLGISVIGRVQLRHPPNLLYVFQRH